MLSLHPFYIPRRLESTGLNSDCQRVFTPATPYSPYLSPVGRGRGPGGRWRRAPQHRRWNRCNPVPLQA